jgi:hypothetical protein
MRLPDHRPTVGQLQIALGSLQGLD